MEDEAHEQFRPLYAPCYEPTIPVDDSVNFLNMGLFQRLNELRRNALARMNRAYFIEVNNEPGV